MALPFYKNLQTAAEKKRNFPDFPAVVQRHPEHYIL